MSSRFDSLVKSIIFPRPKRATFSASTHPDALLHIPCVSGDTFSPTGLFTNGYLFRQPGSTHLLIYAHPNAVDIGMIYEEMRQLSLQTPVDVLSFEYSGYGLTHCEITEASVYDDMASAYSFAVRFLSTPADRIILCGRSIGAAPAARLCAHLPVTDTPSLLVLQCPFTALSECIEEFSHNAVSLANMLGYNWFRTIDLIADVRCPVVLHHGTHDTTVPISHSYELKKRRDAAARPCVTYLYQEDGKGHNNLSRSLLVQIIKEKVDTAGLAPLHTAMPSNLVAHAPLYPHFFRPAALGRKGNFQEVLQHWQHAYNLDQFLLSIDSLYALLTASVCSFAVRVSYAWQVYSELSKRNARNSASVTGSAGRLHTSFDMSVGRQAEHRRGRRADDRRGTKVEFIARCIACWGSPVGVHVPVAGLSANADAVIFGSHVPPGKWGTFDVGWHFSIQRPAPMITVAELPVTPGLMAAIQKIVSSAPELIVEKSDSDEERRRWRSASGSSLRSHSASHSSPGDTEEGELSTTTGDSRSRRAREEEMNSDIAATLPTFIQADLLSTVQTECERIVGCLSDDSAANLQALFHDFEAGCEQRVSAKARSSLGSSLREESFDEMGEWLRPYIDRPFAMDTIAREVPWDYYLFKARVLASRHTLSLDMDWTDCLRARAEDEVVVSLYGLFLKYYLSRVFIPNDA